MEASFVDTRYVKFRKPFAFLFGLGLFFTIFCLHFIY